MKNLWYHRYELVSEDPSQKNRTGALFKIEWSDGVIGYGDCHPWPEFGEDTIDQQMKQLSQGRITSLISQTILMAREEGVLRSSHVNAFNDTTQIKNHFLVRKCEDLSSELSQQIAAQGFETVKIKVGKNVREEARMISEFSRINAFKLRLDFNSKGDVLSFREFIKDLGDVRDRIEFVEDPFNYDTKKWKEASQLVPLALDWESDKVDWENLQEPSFKYLILKPARSNVRKATELVKRHQLKMVVTSSLDHPVGVAHALNQAIGLKKIHPDLILQCGCLTFSHYKPESFSRCVTVEGPYLKSIQGTGIGFDSAFEELTWTQFKK